MFWCRDVKAINSVKLAVWFHDPPDVTDFSDVPDLSICLSIWAIWPVLCIWTVGAFGAIYLSDRSIDLSIYLSDLFTYLSIDLIYLFDLSIWFFYLIGRSIYITTYKTIYLSICLSAWFCYLSICLPNYLPIYLSIYLSTYLPIYLPIYLCTYLPMYLSTYLPIYLSTYLPIYLSIYLPIYLSIYLPIYLSTDLSIYRSIYLSIYLSIRLSIYWSIYRSIYLSFCLSFSIFHSFFLMYLSVWSSYVSFSLSTCLSELPVYLSICLSIYLIGLMCLSDLSTCLSDLSFWSDFVFTLVPYWSIWSTYLSDWWTYSQPARHLPKNRSWTNKHAAIVRDVLQKWKLQSWKRNFARLPPFWRCWLHNLQLHTIALGNFSIWSVESTALATKNWSRVIGSAVPATRNHLQNFKKPEAQKCNLWLQSIEKAGFCDFLQRADFLSPSTQNAVPKDAVKHWPLKVMSAGYS